MTTEAAVCPRCGSFASVSISTHLATGIKQRLLLCDNCRFFEFSDIEELDDGPDHRGDDICKFEWLVLGMCSHGVDLDKAFCPQGCRV